jgi:uncharacterized phage infection (PIP) family protein YhgE
MDKITVDKAHMESLQALAETNAKISEARMILQQLQEDETKYLIEREQKSVEMINDLMNRSKDILETTMGNYSEVQSLLRTASTYSEYLVDLHNKFNNTLSDFNDHATGWERQYNKQVVEMTEMSDMLDRERQAINDDKVAISEAMKKLSDERRLIESRQEQLKSALQVLRNKQ